MVHPVSCISDWREPPACQHQGASEPRFCGFSSVLPFPAGLQIGLRAADSRDPPSVRREGPGQLGRPEPTQPYLNSPASSASTSPHVLCSPLPPPSDGAAWTCLVWVLGPARVSSGAQSSWESPRVWGRRSALPCMGWGHC